MDICGHTIVTDQVIGIGPLRKEPNPDIEQWDLYRSQRYYFDLHLVNRTVVITSEWYLPGDGKLAWEKEHMAMMKNYEADYSKGTKQIKTLLTKRANKN